MVEIKIEKKRGSLWWLWALIALVVIGVLLWIFLDNDRGDGVVEVPKAITASVDAVTDATPLQHDQGAAIDAANREATAAYAAPQTADASAPATGAQPITDLTTITTSDDASLAGRDVRLSRVDVGAVVGDASFWIHDAAGRKVYVVLKEVLTPNTPI